MSAVSTARSPGHFDAGSRDGRDGQFLSSNFGFVFSIWFEGGKASSLQPEWTCRELDAGLEQHLVNPTHRPGMAVPQLMKTVHILKARKLLRLSRGYV